MRLWFGNAWILEWEVETEWFSHRVRICAHMEAFGRWKVSGLVMPAREGHIGTGTVLMRHKNDAKWRGGRIFSSLSKVQILPRPISGFVGIVYPD